MAQQIRPPVVAIGIGDEHGYLDAAFAWGDVLDHALDHEYDDDVGEVVDASVDDFAFYDVTGASIEVNPADPTLPHTIGASLPTFLIRAAIRNVLHDVAPEDPALNPRPELLAIIDDPTRDFETVLLWLAYELQVPEDTLDPHRRGYWHNLCHRLFRHR